MAAESSSEPNSRFYLEGSGYVRLALMGDGLLWHRDREDPPTWAFSGFIPSAADCIHVAGDSFVPSSEIYAVEALPEETGRRSIFRRRTQQLHRIAVHTFKRKAARWIPRQLVFGHKHAEDAREMAERIREMIAKDPERPRSLLVFVNPHGGHRVAPRTWEAVRPVFDRASVHLKVVITERRHHAYEVVEGMSGEEMDSLDGVVVVGGDGFFNEVLNGLVKSRHMASSCPRPRLSERQAGAAGRNGETTHRSQQQQQAAAGGGGAAEAAAEPEPEAEAATDAAAAAAEAGVAEAVGMKCLKSSNGIVKGRGEGRGEEADANVKLQSSRTWELETETGLKLSRRLRIGIIPAGSTDTIIISATGSRDPLTSALNIVLGRRMPLDVARFSSWEQQDAHTDSDSHTDKDADVAHQRQGLPGGGGGERLESAAAKEVRYAASFAGYGFYGDVGRHSEELRWMGPMRYDFAGFYTYLRHKSYEAEVSYLDMPHQTAVQGDAMSAATMTDEGMEMEEEDDLPRRRRSSSSSSSRTRQRLTDLCISGCITCANGRDFSSIARSSHDYTAVRWSSFAKGSTTGCMERNNNGGSSTTSSVDIKNAHDMSSSNIHGNNADIHVGQLGVAHGEVCSGEGRTSGDLAGAVRWKTVRGRFQSVGAAIISCRNEKAPDGMAAHAHLADGNLDLILIRECSRVQYLRQLINLAARGADPFDFSFVEHYKTPAFTFVARGRPSIWSVDGEAFQAKEVSVQVFRGLVDLFAAGPEI